MFRSWGRVGTTIGSNKLDRFYKKHEAIESFKEVYLDKTGNDWDERKTAGKKPNKFYPLEMDYGDEVLIYFIFCLRLIRNKKKGYFLRIKRT